MINCILVVWTVKFNEFKGFCNEFCENVAFTHVYEIKTWYDVCKPQYHFQIVLDPLKGANNIIFISIMCLCKDFAYSIQ